MTCKTCNGCGTVLCDLRRFKFGEGFRAFFNAGTVTTRTDSGETFNEIVCPACDGSGVKEGEVQDGIPV